MSYDILDSECSQDSSFTGSFSKKRRSNNDQLKVFENMAKDMKESQMKKMEFIQQIVQPKTELELFFASACKTVERFTPLEQAKVKMSVSKIVSEMEFSHLENELSANVILTLPVIISDENDNENSTKC